MRDNLGQAAHGGVLWVHVSGSVRKGARPPRHKCSQRALRDEIGIGGMQWNGISDT